MVLQVPPSYTEHAKEFPINPSNKVPERNSDRHNTDEDISRREFLKKAGMIAAGLIGAGAVGGGIGATIFGGKEKEPVATNPNVEPVTEPVEAETPAVVETENETETEKDVMERWAEFDANMSMEPKERIIKFNEIAADMTDAQLTEALKIPTGLNDEDLGAKLMDRLMFWKNAGENDSFIELFKTDREGIDHATLKTADKNSQIFEKALFTPDWRLPNNSDTTDTTYFFDRFKTNNNGCLKTYATDRLIDNLSETDAFKVWFEITKVENHLLDESVVNFFRVYILERSNARIEARRVDNPAFMFAFKFKEIDGYNYISYAKIIDVE